MIKLTWRQFRIQALVVFGALAVVAVILAITGPHLAHVYAADVAMCKATQTCPGATSGFLLNDQFLQESLGMLLLVVPVLLGIFWGAPLIAREIETGTYRLVLTQSVTRRYWFLSKFSLVGLASITASGFLSLMVTWWSSPFDRIRLNRFTPAMFGERALAPIGYAAFAFAFAAVAGLIIRRTLPAMASTLVAFVAARLAISTWVRPHYSAPTSVSTSLRGLSHLGFQMGPSSPLTFTAGTPNVPNAWMLSSQLVDHSGDATTDQANHQFLVQHCPGIVAQSQGGRVGAPVNKQSQFQACLNELSTKFHAVVTYQPANRYWAFQWYEMAIFLAVAMALGGLGLWWLQHRTS